MIYVSECVRVYYLHLNSSVTGYWTQPSSSYRNSFHRRIEPRGIDWNGWFAVIVSQRMRCHLIDSCVFVDCSRFTRATHGSLETLKISSLIWFFYFTLFHPHAQRLQWQQPTQIWAHMNNLVAVMSVPPNKTSAAALFNHCDQLVTISGVGDAAESLFLCLYNRCFVSLLSVCIFLFAFASFKLCPIYLLAFCSLLFLYLYLEFLVVLLIWTFFARLVLILYLFGVILCVCIAVFVSLCLLWCCFLFFHFKVAFSVFDHILKISDFYKPIKLGYCAKCK